MPDLPTEIPLIAPLGSASPYLEDAYAQKVGSYYTNPRGEMMPFLPRNAKRFLDVGCGNGDFGATIKRKFGGEIKVWGVEMHPPAAERARAVLNKVICAPFSRELDLPADHFDCIVCNDVLEHLVDPQEALRYAATLLTKDGKLVASIPNLRYFPTLYQLVVQGKFDYESHGILDRTHLRFFTKSSIGTMFRESGYEIESITGIRPAISWKWNLLNRLFLRKIEDTRFPQFAVVAKKNGDRT